MIRYRSKIMEILERVPSDRKIFDPMRIELTTLLYINRHVPVYSVELVISSSINYPRFIVRGITVLRQRIHYIFLQVPHQRRRLLDI